MGEAKGSVPEATGLTGGPVGSNLFDLRALNHRPAFDPSLRSNEFDPTGTGALAVR